jgi:hypothetical protein
MQNKQEEFGIDKAEKGDTAGDRFPNPGADQDNGQIQAAALAQSPTGSMRWSSHKKPDYGQIQAAALALLPPPGTLRWGPHTKAAVVAAVRGGFLSLEQARERYALSLEEYIAWQQGMDLFGLAGLRMGGMQKNRRAKRGASA